MDLYKFCFGSFAVCVVLTWASSDARGVDPDSNKRAIDAVKGKWTKTAFEKEKSICLETFK